MFSKTASIFTLTATVALAAAGLGSAAFDKKARMVPPPAVDEQRTEKASTDAVLAGGCFWGVQGVFQHVKGVTNAVSGTPAVRRMRPSMNWSAAGVPATRKPCG